MSKEGCKKAFKGFLMAVLVMGIFWVLAPTAKAQAAAASEFKPASSASKWDYSSRFSGKAGNYYVRVEQEGIVVSKAKKEKGTVVVKGIGYDDVMSDGKTIIYGEGKYNSDYTKCTTTFYQVNMSGKNKKKLYKVNGSVSEPFGYSKGIIYINIYDKTKYNAVAMNLKTGKTTILEKNLCINMGLMSALKTTNKSLYLGGEVGTKKGMPLSIYDIKTKKKVDICKTTIGAAIKGNKLYYADCTIKNGTAKVKIIQSDLVGKGKKTIGSLEIKKFQFSDTMTSDFLLYYSGTTDRRQKYDFKTKEIQNW